MVAEYLQAMNDLLFCTTCMIYNEVPFKKKDSFTPFCFTFLRPM